MKYKVKVAWPGVKVGDVLEVSKRVSGCIFYDNEYSSIEPHEIALMVHCGFLEEVKEEWPQVGDTYWYIELGYDGEVTVYSEKWTAWYRQRKAYEKGLIYRTKTEADAAAARVKEALRGNK